MVVTTVVVVVFVKGNGTEHNERRSEVNVNKNEQN